MRDVICTRKVFVKVIAEHEIDGSAFPVFITFANGVSYRVDRVLSTVNMSTIDRFQKGIRYTVEIAGKTAYLTDELDGRWSVQEKVYSGSA